MASCSIRWCGKNSKKSNYKTDGITFHRFPQEAGIKEKWITCTKRENWFPSNYSVVCSRHFTEDCFYTMKNGRRLFANAIPTMHLPLVSHTAVTSDCAHEDLNRIPSSSSENESILAIPKTTEQKTSNPVIPPQLLSPTKKRLRRRVIELSMKVKQKNKTIKDLRAKVQYYKKSMASLKLIIKDKIAG